MDIGAIKSTSEALSDAVWQGDLPNLPGVEFCVRGSASAEVVRATGKLYRAAGKPLKDLTDADHDKIDLEVKATASLVDWRGLTSEGEPYVFSPEAAREMLQYNLFYMSVQVAVNRLDKTASEHLGALAKNSSTPSKAKPKAAA